MAETYENIRSKRSFISTEKVELPNEPLLKIFKQIKLEFWFKILLNEGRRKCYINYTRSNMKKKKTSPNES